MSLSIVVYVPRLQENQKEMIRRTAETAGCCVSFFDRIEDALPAAAEAEILYCGGEKELVAAAENMRWLCCAWAGVEHILQPGLLSESVLLTNSSGAYGTTIAEHVFMVTLMLLRHQPEVERNMREGTWTDRGPQDTIRGSRVTLLGAGDIGRSIAERLSPFKPACIRALNRTGRSDAGCFDSVFPISELHSVLPETDILILCLPGTPDTRNILNEQSLSLLPSNAVVINVGRGAAIEEAALAEALKSGRIAGAALDVLKEEPPAADNPLLSAPNLILTPHVAGNLTAEYTRNKDASMFCDDLLNYCAGLPMEHLVDRKLGY